MSSPPPHDPESCAAAIAELERTAERAQQARDELVSTVSHDLRGPLNAISVALDGLRDASAAEGSRERYVAAIQRSIDKAERLLRDLVTAHQIERGRLQVEPRSMPVRELLEQVARDHELAASQAKCRIVVECEDGLDAIVADRDRIAQSLGCLVANALRHGRGSATVELGARRAASGGVTLTVRDHGPGIAENVLPHVFDPAWSGHRKKGGLGLQIVRGVARAHGGEAHAARGDDGGAVFTMELPASS